MSERGNFRGRGGGGGGGRGGSERGRAGGGRGGHTQGAEKPKKENILDLAKYTDKQIMVKFNGGRESVLDPCLILCSGTLFCEIKGVVLQAESVWERRC